MKKEIDYEINHIKVLDGIRALAIIIIVWYHFWQQSWIMPIIGSVNLEFIPRYGFLFVDMLILLSGFCLFLPYARSMAYKEKMPDTKKFYINRIARIIPSYLVSMIISIIFIIILSTKINPLFFIKDTITHLSFTHNLFIDTLKNTNYMTVLWTVGVEMQFYLVFPYLAKKFMKNPVIVYLIMLIIGLTSTLIMKHLVNDTNSVFYANHFLTFIPVFANGMLASLLYVKYTKNKKRNIIKDIVFMVVSILCIVIYKYVCMTIGPSHYDIQLWQINNRFFLSILFSVFFISTIMSYKLYRFLFENKLMKFIAIISFNLYIYHQFIAVKLKEFRIPFWEGDTPPNMLSDTKWQWTYFILCIVISVVVALIMTYGVEKPISKIIKNKYLSKKAIKE